MWIALLENIKPDELLRDMSKYKTMIIKKYGYLLYTLIYEKFCLLF